MIVKNIIMNYRCISKMSPDYYCAVQLTFQTRSLSIF